MTSNDVRLHFSNLYLDEDYEGLLNEISDESDDEFEKQAEQAYRLHHTKSTESTIQRAQSATTIAKSIHINTHKAQTAKCAHRPATASAARVKAPSDLLSSAVAQLDDVIERKTMRSRPQSAHNLLPQSAQHYQGINKIREMQVRPNSQHKKREVFNEKWQTQGSRNSKQYLKDAQERKRRQDMLFKKELSQELVEFERKILNKVDQANALLAQQRIGKLYQFVGERNGVTMVKSILTDRTKGAPPRLISAVAFLGEFEKLSSSINTSYPLGPARRPNSVEDAAANGNANGADSGAVGGIAAQVVEGRRKKLTKKQIQEELRRVLSETMQLSKTLTSQLTELQRKGWNCSSSVATVLVKQ